MDKSDFSGDLIEPNAKSQVIVRTLDGRARRLTVTSAEADKFASSGLPVGGPFREVKAFALRNWKTFAWWAFALLVASLVLPAATKQWADRQAALTIKSTVTTEISKSAVSAVQDLQDALQSTSVERIRKTRTRALNSWIGGEAGIDAIYHVYFDNTAALSSWDKYRNAVYYYLSFVCCDKHREADVRIVQNYLQGSSHSSPIASPLRVHSSSPTASSLIMFAATTRRDMWSVLDSSSVQDSAFKSAYISVGLQLLKRRGNLLVVLLHAKASGYSSGFADFWRDVIPGL